MTFGTLQKKGAEVLELGTVRVSWPEAKIMAYFLLLNIAFEEAHSGPIKVPPSVSPRHLDDLEAALPKEEKAEKLIARMRQLRTVLDI